MSVLNIYRTDLDFVCVCEIEMEKCLVYFCDAFKATLDAVIIVVAQIEWKEAKNQYHKKAKKKKKRKSTFNKTMINLWF